MARHFGGANPSTVSDGGTYRPPGGYRPPQTVAGPEAIAASAMPVEVEQAARDALAALRHVPPTPAPALREYVRRFQQAYGQRLTIDGVYGARTQGAISSILDIPIAQLPSVPASRRRTAPSTTSTTPAPPRAPTATAPVEPPARLVTAIALARWTADAVANDATAARQLRTLNENSSLRAVRTADDSLEGDVGRIPDAPDTLDITTRARAAWERVRAAGGRASADLDASARRAVAEGERALREVRRALDAEVDLASRQALSTLEATLTAILRPASRAIATAVRPIAGPALLIGGFLLVLYFSKK